MESLASFAPAIVETIREPIVVLDADAIVRFANSAFAATFDISPMETIGRPLFEVGAGQWNLPRLRTLISDLLTSGRAFEELELEARFGPLGRRVILISGRRLVEPQERCVLLVLTDVTERRRVDELLAWHARELSRSNDDLELFASAASHELQEPTRKVRRFSERLATLLGRDGDPQAIAYVERIDDAATRMQHLIHSLLDFARLASRQPQYSWISLEGAVREALSELGREVADSQASISIDTLPTVRADPVQMSVLFRNLLSNALKYHLAGERPEVRVCTVATSEPGVAMIAIHDHGIGIAAEHREQIFGPFERLHPRGQYAGAGLGLSIARRIAERHSGSLSAHARPGGGSTFLVTLPVDRHGRRVA